MKYISILRGINVSGQKKIKMADLKILFENEGYSNVVTYIQSGNIVFDSKSKNRKEIKQKLEITIEKQYGFYVPIDIRTDKEIKETYLNCPFEEAQNEENGTKVLVTFLLDIPNKENISTLMAYVKTPEKLFINSNVTYLCCPNGYGKSKLSNTFIESKLKTVATTRNWKTIKKLYELSNGE